MVTEDNLKLNDLFVSNNIEDVLKFYNKFSNRDELFQWMKDRPKSNANIEVNNFNTKAVVVIPTKDCESKYAQACKTSIFNNITQVFVESVKPVDYYFNYARNVNIGVAKAMELSPDWIIISNDDMEKIDPPEKLLSELTKFDSEQYDTLFTNPPGRYHSFYRVLASPNMLYSLMVSLHPNRYRLKRFELWRKFEVKNIDALDQGIEGLLSKVLYSKRRKHLLTGSFTILSSRYVEKLGNKILDETFINGGEDSDLSIRLKSDKCNYSFINYKIKDLIGNSLGYGWTRIIRNVVNEIYLSSKIENMNLEN